MRWLKNLVSEAKAHYSYHGESWFIIWLGVGILVWTAYISVVKYE